MHGILSQGSIVLQYILKKGRCCAHIYFTDDGDGITYLQHINFVKYTTHQFCKIKNLKTILIKIIVNRLMHTSHRLMEVGKADDTRRASYGSIPPMNWLGSSSHKNIRPRFSAESIQHKLLTRRRLNCWQELGPHHVRI